MQDNAYVKKHPQLTNKWENLVLPNKFIHEPEKCCVNRNKIARVVQSPVPRNISLLYRSKTGKMALLVFFFLS